MRILNIHSIFLYIPLGCPSHPLHFARMLETLDAKYEHPFCVRTTIYSSKQVCARDKDLFFILSAFQNSRWAGLSHRLLRKKTKHVFRCRYHTQSQSISVMCSRCRPWHLVPTSEKTCFFFSKLAIKRSAHLELWESAYFNLFKSLSGTHLAAEL